MNHLIKFVLVVSLSLLTFKTNAQDAKLVKKASKQWLKMINKNDDAITQLYAKDAGQFYLNEFTQTTASINEINQKLKTEAVKFKRFNVSNKAFDNDGNYIEMAFSRSKNKTAPTYIYINAWRKTDNGYQKELEIIDLMKGVEQSDYDKIDTQRIKWQLLSNQHKVADLLEITYEEDAIYYNNGEAINETVRIAGAYAYMKDDYWRIELKPVQLVQVNETTAFEIGKYVSRGEGLYAFVWRKQESGFWKLSFDFNF